MATQKALSLEQAKAILERQREEDEEVLKAREVLRADLQRRSRERTEEAIKRKSERLHSDAERVTTALEAALTALRPVEDALARIGGSPSVVWIIQARLARAKKRLELVKEEGKA
jgi:hypothetical protein